MRTQLRVPKDPILHCSISHRPFFRLVIFLGTGTTALAHTCLSACVLCLWCVYVCVGACVYMCSPHSKPNLNPRASKCSPRIEEESSPVGGGWGMRATPRHQFPLFREMQIEMEKHSLKLRTPNPKAFRRPFQCPAPLLSHFPQKENGSVLLATVGPGCLSFPVCLALRRALVGGLAPCTAPTSCTPRSTPSAGCTGSASRRRRRSGGSGSSSAHLGP